MASQAARDASPPWRFVAVSGASGFIGRRIAENLARSGVRVSGLDIAATKPSGLPGSSDAESPFSRFVQGDICDSEKIQEWLAPIRVGNGGSDNKQGLHEESHLVELVVHCAAIVADSGDWQLFNRINGVSGALVAREAWRAGIKRFIHLSSIMVYGFDFPEGVSEENDLTHFRGENNPYCQTKIDSERLLQELREEMRTSYASGSGPQPMDIVIVRPGDVIGPGSTWVVPPLHILRRLGSMVVPRGGIINYVFVDNLFDGIMLTAKSGIDGEAYIITDDRSMAFVDFFKAISRQTLGHERVRAVPYPVIFALFILIRIIMAVLILLRIMTPATRTKLNLTLESLKFLSRPSTYSCEKIKSLGYRPRVGIEEAIKLSTAPHR